MSLNQLSPKSLENILKCLNYCNESATIAHLRRTSFEINSFAKATGLDKLNVMELRLHLTRSRHLFERPRLPPTKNVVIMLQKKRKGSKPDNYQGFSTPPYSHTQYEQRIEEDLEALLPLGYASILRRKDGRFTKIESYKDDKEKETAIYKMLIEALSKIRSFGMLSLFQLKIDSKFLSKLKEVLHNVSVSKTMVLNIQRCEINLTSDQLTELLDLLPNLQSICLEGTFFNEFMVTDEHIRRASRNLRIIHDPPRTRNIVERDFLPCPMFSEITKDALIQKNGNYPKNVILDGFHSTISFSLIWNIMLNSLRPNPSKPTRMKIDSNMYLGVLEGSKQLSREIASAQRKRQFQWSSYTATRRTMIYQVHNKNSNIFLTFSVLEPRKDPDFNQLLKEVLQLREELNVMNAQEADQFRRRMMSKINKINYDLYEYEWTHKLTDSQVTGHDLYCLNDHYREGFHGLLASMRKTTDLGGNNEVAAFACNPLMHKVDRLMDMIDQEDDEMLAEDDQNGLAIEFNEDGAIAVEDGNAEPDIILEAEWAERLNNQLEVMQEHARLLGADIFPDRARDNDRVRIRMLNNLTRVEQKLQHRIAQIEAKPADTLQ